MSLAHQWTNAMSLPLFPRPPGEGEAAAAASFSPETLELLAQRRSTKIAQLGEPGPSPAMLRDILSLAVRVPDHGKLAPWRFLLLEGEGRARAGAVLAAIQESCGAGAEAIAAERGRFLRAPCVVGVISRAGPHAKIPQWEQELSAGALCFAVLLGAHAAGFAGCWLTEWPTYDARARAALGLAAEERIAGFIYLGSAREPAIERPRPDLAGLVQVF
ncbi:MAG: nitroreductase [Hyphomonadaceae bacterium]|nr:nitroreductase [Hyphomonadaceae bacterium]